MAYRYQHPDGPEYGHCVELSSAEYETVKRALYKALERAEEVGASADYVDVTALLNDLEPMQDD